MVFAKCQGVGGTLTQAAPHSRVLAPEISPPRVTLVPRQPNPLARRPRLPMKSPAPQAPTPERVLFSKGAKQPVVHRTPSSRRPPDAPTIQAPPTLRLAPAAIASRTHSRSLLVDVVTPALTARRIFPRVFLIMWVRSVLYPETGNYLMYRQLVHLVLQRDEPLVPRHWRGS